MPTTLRVSVVYSISSMQTHCLKIEAILNKLSSLRTDSQCLARETRLGGSCISEYNWYPTVNIPYVTQLYQLGRAESIPDLFSDVQSSVSQDNSSLVDADDEMAPKTHHLSKAQEPILAEIDKNSPMLALSP